MTLFFNVLKMLEINSQSLMRKNLRLVRDFARKRRPLRGSFFVGSASSPTGPAGGVACPTF